MINDLKQVDLLHTRTIRDTTNNTITLQVRSGVTVLSESVFSNASLSLPEEITGVLNMMLSEAVMGPAARLNDSGQLVGPSGAELNVGSAVRVTGNLAVGETLTATLTPGWTVTGYQWTRDGVDIAGATNSTYTVVGQDSGKNISVRVTGLAYAATAKTIAGAVYTGILRAASAHNRIATKLQASASTNTTLTMRAVHRIGSGDFEELRIILNNFLGALTTVVGPGNTVTVPDIYLEHMGAGVTTRVQFGASNSRVLTNGESDVVSDAILPSSFGLGKFSRGDLLAIRATASVPAGGSWPQGNYYDYGGGITTARAYDSATASCTNLGGTGVLTFTGTTTGAAAMPMMIVGKFTSGDPTTVLGVGDSILEGYTDTAGANAFAGTGMFSRALVGSGSDAIAGINTGMFGSTNAMWTNGSATMNKFVKYCSKGVYEYGTNSFPAGANDSTLLNAVIAGDRAVYTNIWANRSQATGTAPFQLIGTTLMCRTAVGDETYDGANWGPGGDVFSFNTTRSADVGVANRLSLLFSTAAIRASQNPTEANYFIWGSGNNADRLHPNATGHTLLASQLRALFLTLS